MSAESLRTGRINATLKKIAAAGLTPPTMEGTPSPEQVEKALSDFWKANKPATPKAPAVVHTPTVVNQNGSVGMSPEQLAAIISAVTSSVSLQQAEALKKALRPAQNEKGLHREEDIDPNDRLDKPVVFYAPYNTWIMSFKRIGGVDVALPYNMDMLVFKFSYGKSVRLGNSYQRKSVCTYICLSKKVAEWIRTHPDYRREVFEDLSSALTRNVNLEYAAVLSKHLMGARAIPRESVFMVAAQEGVPISSDLSMDEIHNRIADARASRELALSRNALDAIGSERARHELLAKEMKQTLAEVA